MTFLSLRWWSEPLAFPCSTGATSNERLLKYTWDVSRWKMGRFQVKNAKHTARDYCTGSVIVDLAHPMTDMSSGQNSRDPGTGIEIHLQLLVGMWRALLLQQELWSTHTKDGSPWGHGGRWLVLCYSPGAAVRIESDYLLFSYQRPNKFKKRKNIFPSKFRSDEIGDPLTSIFCGTWVANGT